MTRVKKAVHALKYRRTLLKRTKGYRFDRSKKERAAQEAFFHAGASAFAHRRDKKNDFRMRWQVQIGAALGDTEFSYSKFIAALKKKGIALDRKILADLAENRPEVFKRLIAKVSA